MKKYLLLISLLLFVLHCERGWLRKIADPNYRGCTNENACNFNNLSYVDDSSCEYIEDGECDCDGNVDLGCGCDEAGPSGCDNACGSTAEVDNCGVCDSNNSNDNTTCFQDCAGEWDGNAEWDDCGRCVCGQSGNRNPIDDGTAGCHTPVAGQDNALDNYPCTKDCNGNWGGTAQYDCNDNCAGTAVIDNCGACDSNNSNDNTTCSQDCAGEWDGTATLDDCDVCTGDDGYVVESCYDCAGTPNGDAVVDDCGICDANMTNDGIMLWNTCYIIQETTKLELDNSGLTGEIPSIIENLVNLTEIDLSYNNLNTIPSQLNTLINLTSLNLNSNQINGNIETIMENLPTSLTKLLLRDNNLIGEIFVAIGQLDNLTILDLSQNNLNGEIPLTICNALTNLISLNLSYNELSGEIPDCLCYSSLNWSLVLEEENSYTKSYLLNNKFCPIDVNSSCISDFLINQDSNDCTPCELEQDGYSEAQEDCQYQADINALQDIINNSMETINFNDLDDNQNNIIEPLELGTQTWDDEYRLTALQCINKGLSGEIPASIGNLTSLETLDLSSNDLSGSIPVEIGDLTNLNILQLHFNQLGDEIPQNIGNLINLSRLLLNDNQLSGEIPNSICNLNLNFDDTYYFNIQNNYLCPTYPACVYDNNYSEQNTFSCP